MLKEQATRSTKISLNVFIAMPLMLALSGCSSQIINQALFSMGEQVDCAHSNNNRIDEDARHATCLAKTSLRNDYANYKRARESELAQ